MVDEETGYGQVSDYFHTMVSARGSRDARVKISLLIAAMWDGYAQRVPGHGAWSVEELLDDAEVALGLRRGPLRDHHDALKAYLEPWSSVQAYHDSGTQLQPRETTLGQLDLRHLTAEEVRELRAHTGLTPERFGELLGVSRQRVYVWEESGTRAAQPYLSALLRLYWPRQ